MIDEFDGGYDAGRVHKESALIMDNAYKEAVSGGANTMLPIVGKTYDRVAGYTAGLRNRGYKVYLILNELDAGKAAKRATTRFLTTGRFVDPSYVAAQGSKPVETYQKAMEEGIADGCQWFSNDVAYGERPRLVGERFGVGTIPRGLGTDDGRRRQEVARVLGSDAPKMGSSAAGTAEAVTTGVSGKGASSYSGVPDLGANTASYVPQQAVSKFFSNTLEKMETDDGGSPCGSVD